MTTVNGRRLCVDGAAAVVFAVNSVCWGPYEFGLILACGSSDGAISLLTLTGDQQWDVKKISNAHTVSLTHYCWSTEKGRFCSGCPLCLRVSDPVSAADRLQRCELGSGCGSRQLDRSAVRTETELRQTLRLRRLRQPG